MAVNKTLMKKMRKRVSKVKKGAAEKTALDIGNIAQAVTVKMENVLSEEDDPDAKVESFIGDLEKLEGILEEAEESEDGAITVQGVAIAEQFKSGGKPRKSGGKKPRMKADDEIDEEEDEGDEVETSKAADPWANLSNDVDWDEDMNTGPSPVYRHERLTKNEQVVEARKGARGAARSRRQLHREAVQRHRDRRRDRSLGFDGGGRCMSAG